MKPQVGGNAYGIFAKTFDITDEDDMQMTQAQKQFLDSFRREADLSAPAFRLVCMDILGRMGRSPSWPLNKVDGGLMINWYKAAGNRARAIEREIIVRPRGD
jgi:hypothetical protein